LSFGGRRADADAFVRKADMHRVGISGRMHRDGRDAELLARPQYPQRDLSAIGDQDFFEHFFKPRIANSEEQAANSE